jgi:antitoxin YefM
MGSISYSQLRENLAEVWESVEDTQEAVILTRRGHRDLALIPADELESLLETAHLMRSPRNARRLLEALGRALEGSGNRTTVAKLRREIQLDDDK